MIQSAFVSVGYTPNTDGNSCHGPVCIVKTALCINLDVRFYTLPGNPPPITFKIIILHSSIL